jgi:hypothetical protein
VDFSRPGLAAKDDKLSPFLFLCQFAARLLSDWASYDWILAHLADGSYPTLAEVVVRGLKRESWSADHVASLADAFEAVIQIPYRAILLDRRLTDGSVFPRIRETRIGDELGIRQGFEECHEVGLFFSGDREGNE